MMTNCIFENNRAIVGAAVLFFSDGSYFIGNKLTMKYNTGYQAGVLRFSAKALFQINNTLIEEN